MTGKGRKERRVPLGQGIVRVLRAWLNETGGDAAGPLFPATTGGHMSRDAIERRVTLHVKQAAASCPSLQRKPVTTHSLRHYVDGWVMWLAEVFPLAGAPWGPVPAT